MGVIAGVIASILIIFPTGDLHGKYVARNQPAAIAAMEGLFKTETGAGMVLMGQPNEETGQIDNPIVVNDAAELPHLRNHQGRSEGTRSDSRATSGPPRCRCSTTPTTSWPASGRGSCC